MPPAGRTRSLAAPAGRSHREPVGALLESCSGRCLLAALGARRRSGGHRHRPQQYPGRRKRHQRVPYRAASTYLVFRKDGPEHRDFDREYPRQERARCVTCNALLLDRRRQTTTCSPSCRQKAYRRRSATAV